MKSLASIIGILTLAGLLGLARANETPEAHDVSQLSAQRTTKVEREAFRSKQIQEIQQCLEQEINQSTESRWVNAFWAMGLMRYRPPDIDAVADRVLEAFEQRSHTFQRAALEWIHTLLQDRKNLLTSLRQITSRTEHPKIFAMAFWFLWRHHAAGHAPEAMIRQRFPSDPENPIIEALLARVSADDATQRPEIATLIHHDWGHRAVVFSLQRRDRRYPGRAIIRQPDGQFMRRADGKLFSIPQLALSLSNLPGFLTNGNTPQGIFAIIGTGHSNNVFIGPTQTLTTVLPHEKAPSVFFKDTQLSDRWSRDRYADLLPSPWRDWEPFWEACRAGEAGRFDIIAHGSTIDPSYYRFEPCYPITPSLGCLTALETWSEETGTRSESAQQDLMDAWRRLGVGHGLLAVAEIDGTEAAVTALEVENLLKSPPNRD